MSITADTTSERHREWLRDHHFAMLIDGQLVDGASGQTVEVVDPATEDVIATAPTATKDQVHQAVAAAKRAFPVWRDRPVEERAQAIKRLADVMEARREELGALITLENGKPIDRALNDVDWSIQWSRHVSELRLEPEVIRDDDSAYIELRRVPIGVVAAIIPWNYPFFQTVYKLVPALLTGNTVVIKPAPTSPLNGLVLGELLADLVPSGVVNVLGDDGSVGPELTGHPDVGKVSFTGSTAAGRKVMASAADTVKAVVLELGGNDAAIVLDDADVEKAATGIFSSAFTNSGQVCLSIKRIFVPSSLYDEFCTVFADLARQAAGKVGHGLDPATEYGPLQNARQYENAKRWLDIARTDGTVIAGGEPLPGKGYFIPPTVVRDIEDDSPIVRDETFGPIRPILKYDDLDDAVRRANDTPYGLGGSAWGRDLDRAAEVAGRLEAGTTWVNTHFSIDPDVPFGGRKQSGLGVEWGVDGLHHFTDIQIVSINKG